MQQCVLRHSIEVATAAEISHASLQYHSNISLHAYGFRQSTQKDGWEVGIHIKISLLGKGTQTFSVKGQIVVF